MNVPRVSVIIPTFNRQQMIERAIRSVWAQRGVYCELIVIDDGSTDQTVQKLHELRAEQDFKIIQQTQQGPGAARNKGVKEASEAWIAFLDSDDEWLEDKLSRQFGLLSQEPGLQLIHGEEIWVRGGRRVNARKKHQKSGGWIFTNCLKICCISPSAALIKKEFFSNLGGFNEHFPVCEDYHLWLHMTSQQKVGFIDSPVMIRYAGHDDQLSFQLKAMDYYRVLAIKDVLQTRILSDEWKRAAISELKYKTDILLKGYKKHNNPVRYQEVLRIQNEWL